MSEKTYKLMSRTGAANIALGIIVLVTGIVTGVLMIVNGASLIREKYKLTI